MAMRHELQGQPPPDQFADPISWHEWAEANTCNRCGGATLDPDAWAGWMEDAVEQLGGWCECHNN